MDAYQQPLVSIQLLYNNHQADDFWGDSKVKTA